MVALSCGQQGALMGGESAVIDASDLYVESGGNLLPIPEALPLLARVRLEKDNTRCIIEKRPPIVVLRI